MSGNSSFDAEKRSSGDRNQHPRLNAVNPETDTTHISNQSSGGSQATRIENSDNLDVWYKGIAEPLTTGPIEAKETHKGYRVKTAAKDNHPLYFIQNEWIVGAVATGYVMGGYVLAHLPFSWWVFQWGSTGCYTMAGIHYLAVMTWIYQRYYQPHPHYKDVGRNRHAGDPGGDMMLRTGFPKEKDRLTGKEIVEAPLHTFPALELIYAPHKIKVIDRFFEHVAWLLSYAIPVIAKVMQHLYFERWYSKYHVGPFCRMFDIEVDDFIQPEGGWQSFQSFFTRQVKKEKRPVDGQEDDTVLSSPADCRILVYDDVSELVEMSFKGVHFDLPKLVGQHLAKKWGNPAECSMILARPGIEDYHRFHVPCDCTIKSMQSYDFRMQAIAGEGSLEGHTELPYSHRMVIEMQGTPHIGEWLYIPIGATIVNSIVLEKQVGDHFTKGDELGYFKYGSNVVFLFPRGTVAFEEDIVANTKQHTETRVLMGNKIGKLVAGRSSSSRTASKQ